MNGIKKNNTIVWIIPFALTALGIVIIFSALSVKVAGGALKVTLKQFYWFVISWSMMVVAYSTPLQFFKERSSYFLLFSWVLVWLPIMPGIGVSGGGANRWIRLGPIAFQPLELMVFFWIVHLSKIYSRGVLRPFRAFVLTLMMWTVLCTPVLLQPDLGGTLLLFFISMGIYVGSYGLLMPLLVAISFIPLFFFAVNIEDYRARRITAWTNPWSSPHDVGYQTIQSLSSFANGGIWGTGLGKSIQRSRYLPASHTDYIFAVLGETLGVIGSLSVLLLYIFWFGYLCYRSFLIEDLWKKTLLWGVVLSIALPVFINIGGITNLIPMTGMPLPFISYGGTSLVVSWFKVGFILRILKESEAGI